MHAQRLRRTNTLVQSGLATLFPDEADGLQLMYGTLDRDLLQAEKVDRTLLTALASTHEDVTDYSGHDLPGFQRCMD